MSLPLQACWSVNKEAIHFSLISYVSWVLANIMTQSSCWFWKLRMQILVEWFAWKFYTNFLELMKAVGSHGQLITAIHDEGDGLTLCEQLL